MRRKNRWWQSTITSLALLLTPWLISSDGDGRWWRWWFCDCELSCCSGYLGRSIKCWSGITTKFVGDTHGVRLDLSRNSTVEYSECCMRKREEFKNFFFGGSEYSLVGLAGWMTWWSFSLWINDDVLVGKCSWKDMELLGRQLQLWDMLEDCGGGKKGKQVKNCERGDNVTRHRVDVDVDSFSLSFSPPCWFAKRIFRSAVSGGVGGGKRKEEVLRLLLPLWIT